MDPQPSKKAFSASGVWSAASSSVIDTRSEPPLWHKRDPERTLGEGDARPPSASDPPAPQMQKHRSSTSVPSRRDPVPSMAPPQVPASTALAKSAKPPSANVKSGSSHGIAAASAGGAARMSSFAPSPRSAAGGSRDARCHSTVGSRPSSGWVGGDQSSRARDPDHECAPSSPGLDPPDGTALSGLGPSPSASDSGGHRQSYPDPPSRGATSHSMHSSRGSQEPRAGVYQPKSRYNPLAMWDEASTAGGVGASAAASSATHFSHYLVASPAASRSPSPSSSSSRSSGGRSSPRSGSGWDAGASAGPSTGASDIVGQALALRGENGSRTLALRGTDGSRADGSRADGSRALALRGADESRADSRADGRSVNRAGSQALVARDDRRYLSAAVDNHRAMVPVDSNVYEAYDHTFVTCPERLRFQFLHTFVKKNLDKKVMIFFSTASSLRFHAKVLSKLRINVITLHGQQTREKFVHRFLKFSDLGSGVLCATDEAGRDLDIPPSVDWVVQFEPPDDPSEYILRVARISCDPDRVGRSLLFLNPGEQGFLKYYHAASIPVSEFEIPFHKLAEVQERIEDLVNDNERLLQSSRDAYGSYLIAHASHGFRDVYNVHDLNKHDVATAFGLVGLPPVDDMTMETETIAGRSPAGGGLEGVLEKTGAAKKTTWDKKEKPRTDNWMKGAEKSWPHSQIKLHPKFNEK